MSLRSHPERNIIICGLPNSGVEEVGRTVSRRIRRQLVDVRLEVQRKTAAMRWPWNRSQVSPANGLLSQLLEQFMQRNSQVLVLACDMSVGHSDLQLMRDYGYLVFIDKPLDHLSQFNGGIESGTDAAGESIPDADWELLRDQLTNCDLYIGPEVLPTGLYSKLVIHCFFS